MCARSFAVGLGFVTRSSSTHIRMCFALEEELSELFPLAVLAPSVFARLHRARSSRAALNTLTLVLT